MNGLSSSSFLSFRNDVLLSTSRVGSRRRLYGLAANVVAVAVIKVDTEIGDDINNVDGDDEVTSVVGVDVTDVVSVDVTQDVDAVVVVGVDSDDKYDAYGVDFVTLVALYSIRPPFASTGLL